MPEPLVRKLQSFVRLSDADTHWLAEALGASRVIPARRDIIEEGDDPHAVNVILDDWACRYRQLSDGRRQIVSLPLPGDTCDPYTFLIDRMDHAIGTITPVRLAQVRGAAKRALSAQSMALDDAFHREALAVAAVQREWVVSLGCL